MSCSAVATSIPLFRSQSRVGIEVDPKFTCTCISQETSARASGFPGTCWHLSLPSLLPKRAKPPPVFCRNFCAPQCVCKMVGEGLGTVTGQPSTVPRGVAGDRLPQGGEGQEGGGFTRFGIPDPWCAFPRFVQLHPPRSLCHRPGTPPTQEGGPSYKLQHPVGGLPSSSRLPHPHSERHRTSSSRTTRTVPQSQSHPGA